MCHEVHLPHGAVDRELVKFFACTASLFYAPTFVRGGKAERFGWCLVTVVGPLELFACALFAICSRAFVCVLCKTGHVFCVKGCFLFKIQFERGWRIYVLSARKKFTIDG